MESLLNHVEYFFTRTSPYMLIGDAFLVLSALVYAFTRSKESVIAFCAAAGYMLMYAVRL